VFILSLRFDRADDPSQKPVRPEIHRNVGYEVGDASDTVPHYWTGGNRPKTVSRPETVSLALVPLTILRWVY
jgi:hypothetical protein